MAYCSSSSSHLSLPCSRIFRDLVLCPFPSRSHLKLDHTWFFQTKKGIRVRNAPQNKLSVVCVAGSKAAVTGNSWEKSILKSETPVLVEFYASWCGPCRMVHRVIDELAEEYAGKLKCFILNTDKDSEITEEYEIKAVPVVLLFKNGEKCDTIVGTMPKEFYVAAIEKILVS